MAKLHSMPKWLTYAPITLLIASLSACGGGSTPGDDPVAKNQVQNPQPIVESALPGTPTLGASTPAEGSPPAQNVQPEVDPGPNAQTRQALVGANMPPVRPYMRTHEYVDVLQQSSGFGVPSGIWNGSATVGADGWPTADFSVGLFSGQTDVPGISGEYTIVFRGQAKVGLIAFSKGTLSTPVIDQDTGLTVVKLTFPAGAGDLSISFTNTNGGIKDLRIIRPGYTWNDPKLPVFTKNFLKHIEPLSTLRFMDWTATNNTYAARWSNRVTLESSRSGVNSTVGGAQGRAWERVIEVANAAQKDIWINIPVAADDNFYTQLATLIKQNLDPKLNVYVEYSNEGWNPTFPQYSWLGKEAVAEEMARTDNTDKKPNHDGTTDSNALRNRVFGVRTFRISEKFREVFGTEMITRVRPVIAWQVGNSVAIEEMIRYARMVYPARDVNTYIYGIASAPYYSIGANQTSDTQTADTIVAALTSTVETLPVNFRYERNAYIAKKYGVKWISYEGGPDMFGPGSLAAKELANRDARMNSLCQKYLTDWYQAGGGLFMWYYAGANAWNSQFGSWTLEEYLPLASAYENGNDPRSAKSKCVNWASTQANVAVKGRHQVGESAAFDAAEIVGAYYVVGDGNYNNTRGWLNQDSVREYTVTAPSAGKFKLVVSSQFKYNTTRFEVSVNNKAVLSNVAMNTMDNTGTTTTTEMGTVNLDAGINVLGFKMTAGPGGMFDKIWLVSTP